MPKKLAQFQRKSRNVENIEQRTIQDGLIRCSKLQWIPLQSHRLLAKIIQYAHKRFTPTQCFLHAAAH